MIIATENLTNPGGDPVHGDRVRYTYQDGQTETKMFLDLSPDPIDNTRVPLTRFAWMRLFTLQELSAIKAASATDQTMAVFLEMLAAAQVIYLGDPTTIAALDYIQAQGFIGATRRQEIEALDYQVQALSMQTGG